MFELTKVQHTNYIFTRSILFSIRPYASVIARSTRKHLIKLKLWNSDHPRRISKVFNLTRNSSKLSKNSNNNRPSAIKLIPLESQNTLVLSKIKIGILNARSLRNKSTIIYDWINCNKFCLAAIVETWHDGADDINIIASTPPGFNYVERSRDRILQNSYKVNHGGVALFYSNIMHVRTINLPHYDHFEYLSVFIHGSGIKSLVIVLYRPSSMTVTDAFFESLSDLIERTNSYKSLMIMGDINIHLDDLDNVNTIKFGNLLTIFGLIQHVKSPTHIKGHILDFFITRSGLEPHKLLVNEPIISDHSAITVYLNNANHSKSSIVRQQKRLWRSLNFDEFINKLEASTLAKSPPTNVDDLFNLYDSTICSILDELIPLKVIEKRSKAASARWFNSDCRAEKILTRRLEKSYRKNPTLENKKIWRTQFSSQRFTFERCFKEYWTQTICDNKTDLRALWSQVNILLKPPSNNTTQSLTADNFADFFKSKVDDIRLSCYDSPKINIIPRVTPGFSSFKETNVDEISELIKIAPPKHCNLDPVPTWLIKKAISSFAPILTNLCNATLSNGYLPASLKRAIVTPLIKKNNLDPDQLSSYRPISNLTFISKIIEKVVASRINIYFESNKLLPERQSAYRKHHSTETAITIVHNDLICAIDSNRIAALMLLDLSSAFDTVDHDILLSILNARFGINEIALQWFKSYLSERTQKFVVNQNTSKTLNINYGVPQGSVLGPLEFITYTESVTKIFEKYNLQHHLFADDKQTYSSVHIDNFEDLSHRLENCASDIAIWCSSHFLKINESKTEIIWFGKKSMLNKLSTSNLSINIGSNLIKANKIVRDLGVLMDPELNMKQHVARLTSTAFYQLRRLKKLRILVGRELTEQLVHSFVLSRLDYGNSVLANLPYSTLLPLQRVQNAAARLILNLHIHEHISPALKQLHWLPIQLRINYKLCVTMHSIHNNKCPSYLHSIVCARSNTQLRQGLRSSHTTEYNKRTCSTAIGERAFSYSGPNAWNALPPSLRNIQDSFMFKKQLKTFLFRQF